MEQDQGKSSALSGGINIHRHQVRPTVRQTRRGHQVKLKIYFLIKLKFLIFSFVS